MVNRKSLATKVRVTLPIISKDKSKRFGAIAAMSVRVRDRVKMRLAISVPDERWARHEIGVGLVDCPDERTARHVAGLIRQFLASLDGLELPEE